MRGTYLIGMLVLLFLANLAMLMGMTNWPQRVREGFANDAVAGKVMVAKTNGKEEEKEKDKKIQKEGSAAVAPEPFMDYLSNGFATAPIGSYDGINMAASIPSVGQGFRARLPNEPLAGPPVELGPDNLFYFKNNQCKPECCGATLSCDGGCVCVNSQQRDYVNRRGGNRNHDDGF